MMLQEIHQEKTKRALLIIDVQRGLFEQSTKIYNAEGLLGNINHLIRAARSAGVPVLFVQHENEKNLKKDTHAWQLHSKILPLGSEVIVHKKKGNAFEGTGLQGELAKHGINTVVITGLVTHGCVKATSLGALELGYHVILVSDGHSSYSKDAPDLIAKWNKTLKEKGVELRETTEVVF